MNNTGGGERSRVALIALALGFMVSATLKWWNVGQGAPFTTIDDHTAYDGGFLVWVGHAPPQRMYLESWFSGLSSLLHYVWKLGTTGQLDRLGVNLIADAYRDFNASPDGYARLYRSLIVFVDLATAWFVYGIARHVMANLWRGWAAVLASVFYLFSYNTFWCDMVARPDTLMVFFGMLGIWFTLRAEHGKRPFLLYLGAAALGTSAGLKLHGIFFVFFVAIDLVRVRGWREAWRDLIPFLVVAGLFFCVSAGSPLFDPVRYLKLRLLNIRDDESPWIQWGEQFWAILRGSGWLAAPLALFGVWSTVRTRGVRGATPAHSTLLQVLGWLLLFASIRQLRPYWMLPALPLLYIGMLLALDSAPIRRYRVFVIPVMLGLLVWQSAAQVVEFRRVDYGGLREWIRVNVDPDEPLYIYGYEALELPKTTECIRITRTGLERNLAADVADGMNFMERHVKRWEEESRLVLFDMLDNRSDGGYTYYSFYRTPWEEFEGLISLHDMEYLLVQETFAWEQQPELVAALANDFELAAEVTGAGGGGSGLDYRIYARKAAP